MKREKVRPALPAEFPDTARVLAQLDRILSTPLFQHSKRYPAFLRHVVEQTLRGANDDLKERTLGIAVFGRPPDYDTSADPVVRNTASEVRKRLQEYYSELGHQAELRISLPAGGYVPEFRLPSADHLPVAAKAARPALLRASFGIGATLLAMLVVLGETQLFSQKSAIKRFWAPILQSPDPILVVTDTLVALRDKQQTESGDNSARVREIIDPKIFLAVSEQSAKLAAFLLTQGKHVDYELSVDPARSGALPVLLPARPRTPGSSNPRPAKFAAA